VQTRTLELTVNLSTYPAHDGWVVGLSHQYRGQMHPQQEATIRYEVEFEIEPWAPEEAVALRWRLALVAIGRPLGLPEDEEEIE